MIFQSANDTIYCRQPKRRVTLTRDEICGNTPCTPSLGALISKAPLAMSSKMDAAVWKASFMVVAMMPVAPRLIQPLQYRPGRPVTRPRTINNNANNTSRTGDQLLQTSKYETGRWRDCHLPAMLGITPCRASKGTSGNAATP